jgi:hypothetical protein
MMTELNRRAEYRGLLDNLLTINKTVRDAGIQVVSCVRCWKRGSRIARFGLIERGVSDRSALGPGVYTGNKSSAEISR